MPSPDIVEDVLLFNIYYTNYAELICKAQNPNLFSKQGKKTLFVQQIAHYYVKTFPTQSNKTTPTTHLDSKAQQSLAQVLFDFILGLRGPNRSHGWNRGKHRKHLHKLPSDLQ